jgi:hypothetical protein
VPAALSDGEHDTATHELDGRSGFATADPLELVGQPVDCRDLALGAARTA